MATHPRRVEVFSRDAWTAWKLYTVGGAICGVLAAPPITLIYFPWAAWSGGIIGAVLGAPVALALAGALQAAHPTRCPPQQISAMLAVVGGLLALIPVVVAQRAVWSVLTRDGLLLAAFLVGDALTLAVGARCGVILARRHVRAWGRG